MIYVPAIPLLPAFWFEDWKPSTAATPHVKTYTRKALSGVVALEIETGNADVIPRMFGSARPAFPCSFAVEPPRGYEIVADCARPWPSVWYPMHCAVRRYGLYPKDKPELRAEAETAARGTYSINRWRRGRLAYGPCNTPLPDLTPAESTTASYKVSGWLNRIRTLLSAAEGTPTGIVEDSEDGLQVFVNGWFAWGRHPDGHSTPARDAPAASGIRFYTGYEGTPDSVPYHWLKTESTHERRWHAYDRATGQPITAESYGDPGPMYVQGTGDPNNGWLPEFKGVAANPDPIILPYDSAHSVRDWRDLIFQSEATDSPMVKRMLRGLAAQFRLQFSEIGSTSQWASTLRKLLLDVRSRPGQGIWGPDTGRQLGWPAFLIAQSVKRAGANENRTWCRLFAEMAETAAMPTGIVSRCAAAPNPADVWYDPDHDLAHSFEVPIFWHGAMGCSIQGKRPIANATRFASALYEEAPLMPYYNGHGPPDYAWVAKRGGAPYPTITGGKGTMGDSSNAHAGAALAAHLDPAQRKRWIDAGLRVEGIGNLDKDAGLVAQMQRL